MADEQDKVQEKVIAPQAAPISKRMRQNKTMTSEERRIRDALEDDDVRESLKELHAHKANSG